MGLGGEVGGALVAELRGRLHEKEMEIIELKNGSVKSDLRVQNL